jgi:hypothetical protein
MLFFQMRQLTSPIILKWQMTKQDNSKLLPLLKLKHIYS